MRMRGFVDRKSVVGIVVAVVLLGLAAMVYFSLTGGRSEYAERSDAEYFYDLDADELFLGARLGPGEEPRDPIVRARVYSCGACGSDYFIGHYSRIAPEIHEALDGKQPHPQVLIQLGLDPNQVRQIAAPAVNSGDIAWVFENSEQGDQIKDDVINRCETGAPKVCPPGTIDVPKRRTS